MIILKKQISKLLILLVLFIYSCKNTPEVKTGIWRAVVPTNGGELSFNFEIQKDGNDFVVYMLNGDEKLKMDKSFLKDDSLHIPMEIFDSEIISKVENDKMNGVWRKKRSNLSLLKAPFSAEFGKAYRFVENQEKNQISGKYEVLFLSKDKKDSTVSIGIFQEKGKKIFGTFLTPTGDYRFLEGNVVGDSLKLSCFEGNHVYLFKAKIIGEKLVGGEFWSSISGFESWEGFKNEKATLPDPTKLTFLKEGYKSIDFSFRNQEGKTISLKDDAYKNKVVIVQIMGSWCPNCMDETKFLSPFYKKNKNRGVEIIGLAYEKSTDPNFAYPKIKRLKERFGIEYEVLLGGTNDKADASETLPMLNKIMSFPTTIFIDKKGIVREIHTGFSGPGTGEYYDKFVSDFNVLIDKLVLEK